MTFSRRDFVKTSVLGAVATGIGADSIANGAHAETTQQGHASSSDSSKRSVIICAKNGHAYVEAAYAFLKSGGDTLDAGIRVVKGPEDDPNDDSVGLGGLPNEECVVELDACCMHGPTRRAGSVGGVRNIKNVSMVSKAVMENTGHVMLVGEGAERFAVAMGFPRENLLTDRSRKIWLLWKEFNSDRDWWGPGIASPHWQAPAPESKPQADVWRDRIRQLQQRAADLGIEPEFQLSAVRRVLFPPTGTIHCSVLSEKGEMSGITTTSGLAFKLPGPLRRFAHHWRGLLHRSGRGLRRRDRQRGREHQSCRGSHHRREHATRHVSAGSRHGRTQAYRPQLQRRHEQAALYGYDVLRPAQRWGLCRGLSLGRIFSRQSA